MVNSKSYEGILENNPSKIVPQSRVEVLLKSIQGGATITQEDLDELWDAINILNASSSTTGSVENIVINKIAELVANAPADFDTLKEIADWIADHAEDAAQMNSDIQDAANWNKYS